MEQIMDLEKNIREIQKGLLKWYPFKEGADCLYIGEETDSIFEMLSDKSENFLIRKLNVTLVKASDIASNLHLSQARIRVILSQMDNVIVEGANRNRLYRLKE